MLSKKNANGEDDFFPEEPEDMKELENAVWGTRKKMKKFMDEVDRQFEKEGLDKEVRD